MQYSLGLGTSKTRQRLILGCFSSSSRCSLLHQAQLLTSLSLLVAHSRESSGDLEMEDAFVCMMGLKDHTLMTPSTSKLATLRPEQSTLSTEGSYAMVLSNPHNYSFLKILIQTMLALSLK